MTKQQQTTTIPVAVTAVTALSLLLLSACGTESEPGSGAGGDARSVSGTGDEAPSLSETLRNPRGTNGVKGTVWDIDSVTVGGEKTTPTGPATIRVDADGKFAPSPDCNARTARKVPVDGATLDVPVNWAGTLMLCEKKEEDFKQAFDQVFRGKLTAAVRTVPGEADERTGGAADTKRLTLTAAGGDTIALTLNPPEPLTETTWTVDEVIDSGSEHGDTEGSLPEGTEGKAHLTFSKDAVGGDGTVEGDDGCNRFRGSAKISEDTHKITFGPMRTTRMACPKPETALEKRFAKVLKGEVGYELSHNRLTLLAENGVGLGARGAARK
ncbi:META domain-containing protein [Streptomyces sp. NPDC088258]|uniref:META domain-containing protein n=1 Tax=Streptomyces sp. NPDC088258 TaxID=3365849 RepID=UPI003807EE23